MKKYSEARCMKCPLLCTKRKRLPYCMSFCNGDTYYPKSVIRLLCANDRFGIIIFF